MSSRYANVSNGAFHSRYIRDRVLGRGCFGEVWLCRHRGSKDRYAVKVRERSIGMGHLEETMKDFDTLRQLTPHTGIVRLIEPPVLDVKGSSRALFLVMEYAERGCLSKFILEEGTGISTFGVSHIIRQLLEALRHCHSGGLCHNDVKPENVLVTGVRQSSEGNLMFGGKEAPHLWNVHVVLADFGQAARIGIAADGDPRYKAPEMWPSGLAHPAGDVWMVGVTAFELLTGVLPFLRKAISLDDFNARGLDIKMRHVLKIKEAGMDLVRAAFNDETFADEASQCLEALLSKEKAQRQTVECVISHAWLGYRSQRQDECVLPSLYVLRQHARRTWLHRELRLAVVAHAQGAVLRSAQDQFGVLVGDRGRLSREFTLQWLTQKLGFTQQGADQLFDSIDADKNGELDVDEFAAMALDFNQLPESAFQLAFDAIDVDGDGWVSSQDLLRFGRSSGIREGVPDSAVELAFEELDENKDGAISYDEFIGFLKLNEKPGRGEACVGLSSGIQNEGEGCTTAADCRKLWEMVPQLAFKQIGGGAPFGVGALMHHLNTSEACAAELLRAIGSNIDGEITSEAFLSWWRTQLLHSEPDTKLSGSEDRCRKRRRCETHLTLGTDILRGQTCAPAQSAEKLDPSVVGACSRSGIESELVLHTLAGMVDRDFGGKPREAFNRLCGVTSGGNLTLNRLVASLSREVTALTAGQVAEALVGHIKDSGAIGIGEFLQLYSAGCAIALPPLGKRRRIVS